MSPQTDKQTRAEASGKLTPPFYFANVGLTGKADIWDNENLCLNEMVQGIDARQAEGITEALNSYKPLKMAVLKFLTSALFRLEADMVKVSRSDFDVLAKAVLGGS